MRNTFEEMEAEVTGPTSKIAIAGSLFGAAYGVYVGAPILVVFMALGGGFLLGSYITIKQVKGFIKKKKE